MLTCPIHFFSIFQIDKTGLLGDSYGISAQQWACSRCHYSDTRSAEYNHGGSASNSGERRQHVIYRWRGISSQWLHSTVSRNTLFDQIETKGKQDRCKNINIFAFDWLENSNLFLTIKDGWMDGWFRAALTSFSLQILLFNQGVVFTWWLVS